MRRVTHKDVEKACERYNKALKLAYRGTPRAGYIRWQNVRGDGSSKRGLYVNIADGHASGVTSSDLRKTGDTMRDTIRMIDLAIKAHKSQSFAIIIRAQHCTGLEQRAALRELHKRGLWLPKQESAICD